MNTTEILSCLKQDRRVAPYLAGVYSCDNLPTVRTLPSAIVANTDNSDGPGEHWIAIYLPIDGEPLYFDSYGLKPQQKEFVTYLRRSSYDYNDMQLQSPLSSACGQYAVFFTAMVCRGWTMNQIKQIFDRKNLQDNDAVVTEVVNDTYDMKTEVYDVDFLSKQVCKAMKDVKINGKHVCPIHM